MPFDVDAARAAGYGDDEILSHLTQSRNFDVAGAEKAGYSKSDIIDHLKNSSNAPAPSTEPPEKPNAFSRFTSSLLEQINPVPAIKEYLSRPEQMSQAAKVAAAAVRMHAGHAQPGDRELLQQATTRPPNPPQAEGNIAAELSAPAVTAGGQVKQGNLAGAAGTLVGAYGVPAAVGEGITRAAKPLRTVSRRTYQSSLKPQTTLTPAERAKIVQTGIEEGIPVSESGYEKAAATTDALNQEIANKVAGKSKQLGPVISPKAVAKRVEDVRPTFAEQVNPESDLSALDRSTQEFLRRHQTEVPYSKVRPTLDPEAAGGAYAYEGPGKAAVEKPLTLSEAQAEKQGTYRQLRKKYGELGSAETEAQKSLARGLKEEIVKQYPELAALNERDSALIDLERQLGRFVNRHGNKDIMGIGTPIAAGAAGAIAGHTAPGLIAGIAKSALDNPAIKSQLAIALDRAARMTPSVGNAATAGGVLNAAQNDENLPHYAKGGIITEPTEAIIGEDGPEARIQLTASHPTVPESPETLKAQLEQLAQGKRKAVMFPHGTPLLKRPKGMQSYQDEHANVFIFHPQLTNSKEIEDSIANNALNDLLGAAKEGMGAPDKTELKSEPVAVVGKDDKGVTVQGAITDKPNLKKTVTVTKKLTPPQGRVSVEPPQKEIAARLTDLSSPDSIEIFEERRRRNRVPDLASPRALA